MAIVTLISDMGSNDHYLASIKGAIFSQADQINVVDISHSISPFNIEETAFMLKNCWREFPKGTIHMICVNDVVDINTKHVCIKHEDHFFIGSDNGIFALLFDKKPDEVFEITTTLDSDVTTFPSKNLFVRVACHLARGGQPDFIGRKTEEYKIIQDFRPVVENNALLGKVIFVDQYGNAITNIKRKEFELIRKDRDFVIMFNRASLDIRKISNTYTDVLETKGLAFFNSSDHLEVAIRNAATGNGGGASQLFGLKIGKTLRIEFNDR